MRSLSFYLLRQIIVPFVLITALLTIIVWLTQALRLLDLVINRGQSAGVFAYLSLLMLPSLLAVIIPVAFFGGALYALHRLNTDSELVVMWSAGISRLQLAMPVLIAAAAAMALTYACNLYLMPAGQRAMRDKVVDIRTDIGAAILKEGAFTTPTPGLTVFIRELRPDGQIRGILVHDNRKPDRPITYLAEAGVLARTKDGARLIMRNGTIEQGSQRGAKLSELKFDRYVFDLDQFASPQHAERDISEQYLGTLLHPNLGPGQEARRRIYLAEAHNRLSSPLYCLAFALIALAAAATGHLGRSNYAMRMFGAALLAAALRIVGYGAQGMAARSPWLCTVLYLLPMGGALAAILVLNRVPLVPQALLHAFRRVLPEPAQ